MCANAKDEDSISADLKAVKELRESTGASWSDCRDAYNEATAIGPTSYCTVMELAREMVYVKIRLRWEDLKRRGKV